VPEGLETSTTKAEGDEQEERTTLLSVEVADAGSSEAAEMENSAPAEHVGVGATTNTWGTPAKGGERFRLASWHQLLGRPGAAQGSLSADSVKIATAGQDRLPAVETADEVHQPRIISRRDPLMWQVVDFPLSPYTEAVRSIKLAIDLVRGKVPKKARKAKKIIGITSTSPGEGKSTIAASLAQLIANADKHVMLVDCDLRAPRLTRTLSPYAKLGLLEVLSGDASLEDVIWTDSSKRLNFLPAVGTSRIPHTAEIIAADEIRALLERLRGIYDYVIVDLTPLLPIVDVRATQGMIDHYIFVVEWGRTSIDLVQRSLKDVAGIYSKIFGVVLNKVGTNELKRYEGYGSYGNDKYYRREG
jgi:capsular exopolysaccharide synthesis family protein